MDLDLHVGRPLHRGPLTLFPVWNGHAIAHRDYTFGCALTVEERAGSPVAHELVVHNPGARPALVREGELLEGGQQHRVSVRSKSSSRRETRRSSRSGASSRAGGRGSAGTTAVSDGHR